MNPHVAHLSLLAAAALLSATLAVGPALAAADTGRERFPPDSAPYPTGNQKQQQQQQQQGAQKKKKEQKSQQELRELYNHARALIQDGQYEAGIAAMRELD